MTKPDKWSMLIARVARSRETDFVALVKLAELDPRRDFQFTNLSGVDFSNSDLTDFDFTGANMTACKFAGASIGNANLTDATVDVRALVDAADWHIHSRALRRPDAPSQDALPLGREPDADLAQTDGAAVQLQAAKDVPSDLEAEARDPADAELDYLPTSIGGLLPDLLQHVNPDILEREGYRRRIPASRCLVVAHVDVVPSVVPLVIRLIQLGFPPDGLIIVPKPYSTIRAALRSLRELGCDVIHSKSPEFAPGRYDDAVRPMLQRACRRALTRFEGDRFGRCLLIDDSGLLTQEWSRLDSGRCDAITVQQNGWASLRPSIRKIDVARSAANRVFATKSVATALVRKARVLRMLRDVRSVGVVGMGPLGGQLARELCGRGKVVYTYDKKPGRSIIGCQPVGHWSECVQNADFIFGCTGVDFMSGGSRWLRGCGQKHFASVSSGDAEFLELLIKSERIERTEKFGVVKAWYHGSGPFLILNGGFPVNFDRETEWEGNALNLTRALVALGALQSLYHAADVPNTAIEKLSLASQYILVDIWLRQRMKACDDYGVTTNEFKDKKWWYQFSGGSEYKGEWP